MARFVFKKRIMYFKDRGWSFPRAFEMKSLEPDYADGGLTASRGLQEDRKSTSE